MQFDLPFGPGRRQPAPEAPCLRVGARVVPLRLVANRQARRYVLRLRPDGSARVTVPRGGSMAEAIEFAKRNIPWLEQQLLRQAAQPPRVTTWPAGSEILFRGEKVRLEIAMEGEAAVVRFGSELVRVKDPAADLRPEVERQLRRLAERELPLRVFAFAARHQFEVQRVAVRNQRSRWGSCSRRGTISLNWRLVQTPEFVRDYLVWHELAHMREMNHSHRFWREVERLCPDYRVAEKWLKENGRLLR